jgi:hypothetical protein
MRSARGAEFQPHPERLSVVMIRIAIGSATGFAEQVTAEMSGYRA